MIRLDTFFDCFDCETDNKPSSVIDTPPLIIRFQILCTRIPDECIQFQHNNHLN